MRENFRPVFDRDTREQRRRKNRELPIKETTVTTYTHKQSQCLGHIIRMGDNRLTKPI